MCAFSTLAVTSVQAVPSAAQRFSVMVLSFRRTPRGYALQRVGERTRWGRPRGRPQVLVVVLRRERDRADFIASWAKWAALAASAAASFCSSVASANLTGS